MRRGQILRARCRASSRFIGSFASASEAVDVIVSFRQNPAWAVVDIPSEPVVMREVWRRAAKPDFARRRIHNLRLALTLRHWGVDEFYTRNTKDFVDVGFVRVVNPFDP